ncbi:hypothetical protein [Lactobacillus sp. LL6]|uniref:hypothetical protein n=1 Tax=Lactobacillus sp. LL6 TaxID=2596827 RepID=UPI001185DC38|nr:hypothetical protein [Lactobacillus sp. LL6]TSO25264.1 hypothetical protein FOD82_08475 [Lactobacillus sp. LL6]
MKLFKNKSNPIKKGLQKFLAVITGHAPKVEPESKQASSHSSKESYVNHEFHNNSQEQRPGHLNVHKQYTLHDIGLAGDIHRQVVGSVSQEGSVRYHQQKKRPQSTHDTSSELIDETAAKLSNIGLAGVKKQNNINEK